MFHDDKLQASANSYDGVFIYGGASTFPTEIELSILLESGVVICVLSPTPAAIQVIADATETPLSLSQYAHDGMPFIFHR